MRRVGAEGSLCIFNKCAGPQRERFDPPKVRRGFTLYFQHARCAKAMRCNQSAQTVHFAFPKNGPRHSESDSTHPKCAEGSLCSHFAFAKCAPRHSESDSTTLKCAEGSLCIFKKCTAPQRERFDPPKGNRKNEPTGPTKKRCRRKHYHVPAKQDTSKQPPLDRKSHWRGNETTQPSKTLRLRSETTRRALKATIRAQGQRKQRITSHQTHAFCASSLGEP